MALHRTGRFITVEGIEGVGKSTNLLFMEQVLKEAGQTVVMTREPGGTVLAEKIRDLLTDAEHPPHTPDTELLLMFAARAEHLAEKIRPALARGEWVLCDRFTDATYAYQGAGRGIDFTHIKALEEWLQEGLRPDLTIVLDADVDLGMQRAGKRGDLDRFEQEHKDFFQRVRRAYLDIARREPRRVRVIDASQELPEVQAALRVLLQQQLQYVQH